MFFFELSAETGLLVAFLWWAVHVFLPGVTAMTFIATIIFFAAEGAYAFYFGRNHLSHAYEFGRGVVLISLGLVTIIVAVISEEMAHDQILEVMMVGLSGLGVLVGFMGLWLATRAWQIDPRNCRAT